MSGLKQLTSVVPCQQPSSPQAASQAVNIAGHHLLAIATSNLNNSREK